MPERICMGCMEKYNDKYSICPYCGYNSESSAQEPYHLTPGTVIGGKYIVGKAIGYTAAGRGLSGTGERFSKGRADSDYYGRGD